MIRRYSKPKPSRGTVISPDIRLKVLTRDGACVGPAIGMPGPCAGAVGLDHVRASHGMGMKSETTVDNLVVLCSGSGDAYGHHRLKTENGRKWRPLLLDYIELHGE